jgi:hypothetical protein
VALVGSGDTDVYPNCRSSDVKKILILIAGAIGATIVKKKLDEQQAERALWAEATDTSTGSSTDTSTPPSAG